MRIFYLLPKLGHNGATRQLEMLARSLHRQGHTVTVCQFGGPSPAAARLEQSGVAVHSLGWTRPIDPAPLWRLHGLVRDARPEVLHAWGPAPLRTLALAGRKLLGKVVLSQPFLWHQRPPISALDRWLLRQVARIVVPSEAEAAIARKQGLFLEKITVVPPGIDAETMRAAHAQDAPRVNWQDWPRPVVCVGPLDRHKGFRNAVWTFDFLRYRFEDMHLVFVGTGKDEAGLRQMTRNAGREREIHFLPPRDSAADCLARADVCWVPSLRGGGTQTVLEAMLAARPVIACQVPSLDGLIVDGQSGFCVLPNDNVKLARRTRDLFLDRDLAQQLGSQARLRVLRLFPAQLFVQRSQAVYQQAAA